MLNLDIPLSDVSPTQSDIKIVEDDHKRVRLMIDNHTADPNKIVGLFMVTLVLKRRRNNTELTPVTSMVMVLAESEQGAIEQARDNIMGPNPTSALDASEAMKEGRLTATAHRVPLHIRGWGTITF